MTLRGGPRDSVEGVTSVVADLEDVEDMNAEGPARRGRSADAGLAGEKGVQVSFGGDGGCGEKAHLAAPLRRRNVLLRA